MVVMLEIALSICINMHLLVLYVLVSFVKVEIGNSRMHSMTSIHVNPMIDYGKK